MAMGSVAMMLTSGNSMYRRVEEGSVGLTYRGGRLMPGLVDPGYHIMVSCQAHAVAIRNTSSLVSPMPNLASARATTRRQIPFVDVLEQVPIGMQTATVHEVPCGTNGGALLHFEAIEVVFRLDRHRVWETAKNYSVAFASTWINNPVHHEMNQICSVHSLQEARKGLRQRGRVLRGLAALPPRAPSSSQRPFVDPR